MHIGWFSTGALPVFTKPESNFRCWCLHLNVIRLKRSRESVQCGTQMSAANVTSRRPWHNENTCRERFFSVVKLFDMTDMKERSFRCFVSPAVLLDKPSWMNKGLIWSHIRILGIPDETYASLCLVYSCVLSLFLLGSQETVCNLQDIEYDFRPSSISLIITSDELFGECIYFYFI